MEIKTYPIYDLLDQAAKKFPRKAGFSFLGKTFSWHDLKLTADHVAKGFQNAGLKKGDRVGLMLPNCPFYLVCFYGALKAGLTVVNFNPLYAPRELKAQIEDAGISAMVTLDLKIMYDKLAALRDEGVLSDIIVCRFVDVLPFPKNLLYPVVRGAEIAAAAHAGKDYAFDDLVSNDGRPAPVPLDIQNDVALLQYTGGTTGIPKAAMLTHANLSANVEQCFQWFPSISLGAEKMLAVIPFFHVFSMTVCLNLAVRCAMEIIATPRFDTVETMQTIQKKKPTYFPAVPAIYNAIVNHKDRGKYDLRSIKACISGGAPLPVEVKRAFEDATGCFLAEGYGLTEASPVVSANPAKGENRPGSIGLAMPGTDIMIADLETGLPVQNGERGELCIKGPQIMKGYWLRDDETAATLKDGWLRTGDVALVDADGYIHIVDRIKDMIIVNGYKVYPRQVEEALYMHDGVEECIVAGVHDPLRGEMVKAWIKPKAGVELTEDTLRLFMKDKLSPIECPRSYELRAEPLPKTLIGKLSRKDVLAQEAEKQAAAKTAAA